MMSGRHDWKERAACLGADTEWFFDKYEDDVEPFDIRRAVDALCEQCPVRRVCFAVGLTPDPNRYNNYGVWGGVYLVGGKIDEQANSHKDWDKTYQGLITE